MKKVSFDVQEPYYSYIISGEKTVEGRLNKGKFATIEERDVVLLGKKKIKFLVVKKTLYDTFEQMINSEGINNVIPDKDCVNDAVNIYYKFYTPKQENKFGVLAIKIKKIEDNI